MDAVLTPRYVSTDLQRSQSDPRYERKRNEGYIRGPLWGMFANSEGANRGERNTPKGYEKKGTHKPKLKSNVDGPPHGATLGLSTV